MHNTRIKLTDTIFDIFDIAFRMSGGVPGSITAIDEVIKNGPTIDPDDAFQGLGVVLSLDTNGIYDSRIYILWNDICGRDLKRFMASQRVIQLGLAPLSEVLAQIDAAEAARGTNDPKKPDEWLAKVQARLPAFAK